MHTQVKCFGAGESQIESMLPDGFLRQTDPVVGINASQTTIIFRIAARGRTADECRAKTAPVVATIRERLGKLVFGDNDDELETVVLRLLGERKQTLAVVDWGAGGLVAERLGSVAEADGAYLGGIVAASETMLRQALEVKADLFARHSPASREAAEALAVACRQRFRGRLRAGDQPHAALRPRRTAAQAVLHRAGHAPTACASRNSPTPATRPRSASGRASRR